jgi:hypothetical protein
MNYHEKAVIIEHIIGIFQSIKKLPRYADDIEQLCETGIGKLMVLAEVQGLQDELDALMKRRIDPTN